MAEVQQSTPTVGIGLVEQFDAIVIGAGVAGLYQLYRSFSGWPEKCSFQFHSCNNSLDHE